MKCFLKAVMKCVCVIHLLIIFFSCLVIAVVSIMSICLVCDSSIADTCPTITAVLSVGGILLWCFRRDIAFCADVP